IRSNEYRPNAPRAIATASSASRALCNRPNAFSEASSSACTPSETRFTPAARYPPDPGCLDVGRVGFKRPFGIAGDMPMAADRIENGPDGLRLHQRRGAAAEED